MPETERPAKWRDLHILTAADLNHHAKWLAEHGQTPRPEDCYLCWALASRETDAPKETDRG